MDLTKQTIFLAVIFLHLQTNNEIAYIKKLARLKSFHHLPNALILRLFLSDEMHRMSDRYSVLLAEQPKACET